MKDDRYEAAPLLVEASHLMKRIGVLSQIIIIIVIQGFGILAYLSILDPVAVGVGKENLVQLLWYQILGVCFRASPPSHNLGGIHRVGA